MILRNKVFIGRGGKQPVSKGGGHWVEPLTPGESLECSAGISGGGGHETMTKMTESPLRVGNISEVYIGKKNCHIMYCI